MGPVVELLSCVTLAGAEYVAGHGVACCLAQCARHADRTACHCDGTLAQHVAQLCTAIGIGQDMATGYGQAGVAFHASVGAYPDTVVWIVTTLCVWPVT